MAVGPGQEVQSEIENYVGANSTGIAREGGRTEPLFVVRRGHFSERVIHDH